MWWHIPLVIVIVLTLAVWSLRYLEQRDEKKQDEDRDRFNRDVLAFRKRMQKYTDDTHRGDSE